MKIVDDFLNSFNNNPGVGWSGRKLSAFAAMVTAIYLSIKHATPEIVVELVIVWLLFILLCLGLITVQQIIDLKNGKEKISE